MFVQMGGTVLFNAEVRRVVVTLYFVLMMDDLAGPQLAAVRLFPDPAMQIHPAAIYADHNIRRFAPAAIQPPKQLGLALTPAGLKLLWR